jgi:hypothetical protein
MGAVGGRGAAGVSGCLYEFCCAAKTRLCVWDDLARQIDMTGMRGAVVMRERRARAEQFDTVSTVCRRQTHQVVSTMIVKEQGAKGQNRLSK